MDQPEQNHRNFYRLRYPECERPLLLVERRQYDVAELSEGGMRVVGEDLAGQVRGILVLTDGSQYPVRSRVLRQTDSETVLVDLEGIEFGVLMTEQRRLAAKHYLTF